jgi:hypothetical protein
MAKKINIGSLIASKTKETFSNNQLINSESVKNNIQIIEELRVLIPPLGVDEFYNSKVILSKMAVEMLSLFGKPLGSNQF